LTQGQPRRIALGVCGGIAAYKSAELVRLLVKNGDHVIAMMTHAATRFLGPLTLQALTGSPVRVDATGAGEAGEIQHISALRDIDLMVLAPLTANTAAKLALGLADNFLTSAYLAHRGPSLACPAMNTHMLEHVSTQRNLARLQGDGVELVYGEAGSLACGDVGPGRMAEPQVILEAIGHILDRQNDLREVKVLVSAGPTCEDLDPVRFLSNRSSGKMGLAIANAFRARGAEVTFVHGPMSLPIPPFERVIACRSAQDMRDAILERQAQMNVIVMAAAVADYRPVYRSDKLKKDRFDGVLKLERTPDILAELGRIKPPGQVLVGFAAESRQLESAARGKLERKALDLIFANDISVEGLGFGSDENALIAFDRKGNRTDLGQGSKQRLASRAVEMIAESLAESHGRT